jgi:hypothetical protein
MVDALKDVWRVVASGGALLDLRPLPAIYRLALITPAAAIAIGHIDPTARAEDDAAADAAVSRMVHEGLFAVRSRTEFDIEIVWESVRDLNSYMATRQSSRVTPSYEDLERAYQSVAAGSPVRPQLRASRRLMLAAFDRQKPIQP